MPASTQDLEYKLNEAKEKSQSALCSDFCKNHFLRKLPEAKGRREDQLWSKFFPWRYLA
jgi:hypothetical protein